VFRSGVTFLRDNGKIFYFSPGHETYPIYHDPIVVKVIGNAIRWAAPQEIFSGRTSGEPKACEKILTQNPLEGIKTAGLHKKI